MTDIQKQVDALEARLAKVEAQLQDAHTTSTVSSFAPQSVPVQQFPKREYKKSAIEKGIDAFFLWLRTDWLMKLGAFLLLLAVAWFVNFSFVHNWIGPTARIVLGIISGWLIFLWGYWQIPKYKVPGQVLVGTGGTMVLATLFAARNIYAMLSPSMTLLFMSMVIVVLAVAATLRTSVAIAYLALLGGAIVPFLIDSPTTDYTSLLIYVLLLNIGMFVGVAFRGWRHIIFAALTITALYSTAFTHMDGIAVWMFIVLFFSIFFGSYLHIHIQWGAPLVVGACACGRSWTGIRVDFCGCIDAPRDNDTQDKKGGTARAVYGSKPFYRVCCCGHRH